MTCLRSVSLILAASAFVAVGAQTADSRAAGQAQRRRADRVATPVYAVPRAPAGVKERQTWIPELPSMEALEPPAGWQPSRVEVPWMPATLLRLPRTNIVRAKFWLPHFRFFETFDEYFEHPAQIRTAGGSPGHGRWNISGIGLPDEVLRKVYYLNALKYLPSLRDPINRQLAARGLR